MKRAQSQRAVCTGETSFNESIPALCQDSAGPGQDCCRGLRWSLGMNLCTKNLKNMANQGLSPDCSFLSEGTVH